MHTPAPARFRSIRVALALLLPVLLAGPALAQATSRPASGPDQWDYEQYLIATINGKQVGYITFRDRVLPDGRFETFEGSRLTMSAAGMTVRIVSTIQRQEDAAGQVVRFSEYSRHGLTPVQRDGRIVDGQLELTIRQDRQAITRTQRWDNGVLGGVALLRKTVECLTKDGDQFEYREYSGEHAGDGFSTTTIKRVGWEDIQVNGRKVRALHTISTNPTYAGPMHCWNDDRFRTLAIQLPAGAGVTVRCEACPKAVAQRAFDVSEFFSSTLVRVTPSLAGAGDIRSVRLTLTLKNRLDAPTTLPESDRQKVVESTPDTLVIDLTRPAYPEPPAKDIPLTDELKAFLQPTEKFNCDDPAIRAAAAGIASDLADPLAKGRAIRDWVDRRMVNKTMGVGSATASEALRTRKGDCTEHAVLLVALARAAGIPARTVEGVVYAPSFGANRDILGGHEWAQLYIHGRWVDFDAAQPGSPAIACRVAFAFGTPDGKADPVTTKVAMNLMGNIQSAVASRVNGAPDPASSQPNR